MFVKTWKENKEEVLEYLEFNGYKNPEFTEKENIYYVETLGNALQDVNIIYSQVSCDSYTCAYFQKLEHNGVDRNLIHLLLNYEIINTKILRIFVKAYCCYNIPLSVIEEIIKFYKKNKGKLGMDCILSDSFLLLRNGMTIWDVLDYLSMENMSSTIIEQLRKCHEIGMNKEWLKLVSTPNKSLYFRKALSYGFSKGMTLDQAKRLCDVSSNVDCYKYIVTGLISKFSEYKMEILFALTPEYKCDFDKLMVVLNNDFEDFIPAYTSENSKKYYEGINAKINLNEKLDEIIELIEMGVKPGKENKNMSLF